MSAPGHRCRRAAVATLLALAPLPGLDAATPGDADLGTGVLLAAGPSWWVARDHATVVTTTPGGSTATTMEGATASGTGVSASVSQMEDCSDLLGPGAVAGSCVRCDRVRWSDAGTATRLTAGTVGIHAGYRWGAASHVQFLLEPVIGAGVGSWRIAVPGTTVTTARTVLETAGVRMVLTHGWHGGGQVGAMLTGDVLTGRPATSTMDGTGASQTRRGRIWLWGGAALATAGWSW